jgi:AcrR family transcriptional regulator
MVKDPDKRSAARREDILAAAERTFDAHGFSATTMDMVAHEAGISKGSIYNYFENKRRLFLDVFADTAVEAQHSAYELLSGPGSARRKLHELLMFWFGQLGYYRRLGRLMLEFWATAARQDQEDELARWFDSLYAASREVLTRAIREGVEAGEFRDTLEPSVAAALVDAVLDGIMVQTILYSNMTVDDEFVEALERAILAGLTLGPQDLSIQEQTP